ncbi:hypothetical protein [Herbidospora mongoliensis]|uniref:hypothetical protein n=1 Tax=Herbidospora mongoliensis TaxID=688067 RepID=UPI00083382DE|nr:hypothetical protein [Herbidospora mongoliensis]
MPTRFKRLTSALVAAVFVVLMANPAHADFNPIGSEPDVPHAQPADPDVPERGCATTLSDPTNAGGGIPAAQIVYAWSEENGNRYEQFVERIAKIVDRLDWSLDESSDYDQHVKLSCRTGPAGYARALVVPEKIEDAEIGGETAAHVIEDDLVAAGYDPVNRVYMVFDDFDGTAQAFCELLCVATTDEWDSGTMLHEFIHLFDVDHAKVTETVLHEDADVMSTQWHTWQVDQEFNNYYDPSELTATFYTSAYPHPRKANLATWSMLTAPVCCDVGYSNDLLTAQERTIEADAPYGYPTGFTVAGGGWMQVTPPGPESLVSSRYYDGRRSLTMNVQSWAEGSLSVTRKPAVTPGRRYKFFARLTTGTSGTVKLRLTWYNASNVPISTSDGPLGGLTSDWAEYNSTGVAPTGAATVQLSVVSPAGQTFVYVLDSLQLNRCDNTRTTDGCRLNSGLPTS